MVRSKRGKEFVGRGVSTCAPCDAPFFKNRNVIVVGGGDSAMEEAMELSKHANSVTIVHRRDEFRASKILQERVFKNPKINIKWSHIVTEIVGDKTVQGVYLRNLKTNEDYFFKCDGVFLAIGHEPNTEIFRGQVEMDEKGYIIAKEYTKTSVRRCICCRRKQLIISIGKLFQPQAMGVRLHLTR